MMDLKEVNERLNYYIRPQSFPLAIKLLGSKDKLPQKARIPSRDLGYAVTVCQGVAMARHYGWIVALGKEDVSCAPAAVGLGFVRREELSPPAGTILPARTLEYGKYQYLVVAALHAASFEPDALVIYGNSAQMMRLAQSFFLGGQEVNGIGTGMADCLDIATTKDGPNSRLILPSGGDRVFGTTQDFEMIFALPWSTVEGAMKGLETTHQLGFRYPILSNVRYKPELPSFLDLKKMMGQD
jgi:uncharacterized protein (DUF169 family)